MEDTHIFLTQVECIISNTWKEKVHGNDKSCSQQWPTVPLSSHVNPENYILKQKYSNSVKNVTLQLKRKLFILNSITICYCQIEIRFLVMLIILLLTTLISSEVSTFWNVQVTAISVGQISLKRSCKWQKLFVILAGCRLSISFCTNNVTLRSNNWIIQMATFPSQNPSSKPLPHTANRRSQHRTTEQYGVKVPLKIL